MGNDGGTVVPSSRQGNEAVHHSLLPMIAIMSLRSLLPGTSSNLPKDCLGACFLSIFAEPDFFTRYVHVYGASYRYSKSVLAYITFPIGKNDSEAAMDRV